MTDLFHDGTSSAQPASAAPAPTPYENEYIYLSDVFKFISYYRRSGHQIGRKVGDMLEILTLAAVYRDDNLKAHLNVEPHLRGFSGAEHKVEFAITGREHVSAKLPPISSVRSFIECKKVGVEQTTNGSYKRNHASKQYRIAPRTTIDVRFNPRWLSGSRSFTVTFDNDNLGNWSVNIAKPDGSITTDTIENPHRLIFALDNNGDAFYLSNKESLRDLQHQLRQCRIFEISDVRNDSFYMMVNDCLPGPQTPEKAKQSSFVALDIRKDRFGQFDLRQDETECVSILILTEYSHWEPKSLNMVKACLDHTLVVDDALIIEALTAYESAFSEDFLVRMTKDEFLTDPDVRQVALDIANKHNGRLFRDIKDGGYKALEMDGSVVKVVD